MIYRGNKVLTVNENDNEVELQDRHSYGMDQQLFEIIQTSNGFVYFRLVDTNLVLTAYPQNYKTSVLIAQEYGQLNTINNALWKISPPDYSIYLNL